MKLRTFLRAAGAVGAAAAVMLGLTVTTGWAKDGGGRPGGQAKPTIVIVHGAFADASGWDDVIGKLQRDDYPVLAVANPLRGLASDSAYMRSVIDSVPGPVVLVGHSYGGAVITNAAAGATNVKALVYVAAFVPDVNEVLGQFADPTQYPGALLTPDALKVTPNVPGLLNPAEPTATSGNEVTIDPARFRAIFAADLPQSQTTKMALRQRPVAESVFFEPTTAAAWKTIPSWYAVSTQDKAISPVAERFFARRAAGRARTIEINASHVSFMSHADRITDLIKSAAKATR
jgi:pimeloyl-ACP methyl ester carboxylesterase